MRGYQDSGFGVDFSWDIPLLEDYQYFVLNKASNNSPHLFF
ncbi:hypothetical protein AM1_0381 [Acaryochloris marina MBIC11017]|uniref:Uncharacterized protein n=1 Tax=Acaryochloris marina (strain MBIC 11017) TaxID=329726 RepID=B0C9Z8_ACAM1|nr:hypothetical protein AM1_0381 [Acaryochloris marina MBIC11017]